MNHRKDVQGLRAVAIGAVLLFHFFPELFPNGFLGVDIFFVISGYLITQMLSGYAAKSTLNIKSIISFYYRRIKRILPLHLLYCFVAIVLFTIIANPSLLHDSMIAAETALLFITNIWSIIENNDYFKVVLEENLFKHIWSLSVEIQFYLIVPIFFLLRERCGVFLAKIFLPFVSVLSLLFYLHIPPLMSFNLVFARLWQRVPELEIYEQLINDKKSEMNVISEKKGFKASMVELSQSFDK